MTDPLPNVHVRAEVLVQALPHMQRYDEQIVVVKYGGHAMGDRAIAELSRLLSQSLLEDAIALRMAGDEFIVLLPGSQPQQLDDQIRRIHDSIEAFNRTGEVPFRLSVSMGTALLEGEDIEAFLSQMDRAMYEAKREYHRIHPKAPLFQEF